MDKIKAFFNNNKKTIFYPTIVMLIICIVITLALSVTNAVTAKKIAENNKIKTEKAMKSAMKADKYVKGELEIKEESVSYHKAIKNGKTKGYIFTLAAKGYGGDVSVMVAVNPDCTVNSVQIIDASNETPGLGQNITDKEFYSQFGGKEYGVKTVKSGTAAAENEIDAVTSATYSSKAVTECVNKALEYTQKIIDKEGGAK